MIAFHDVDFIFHVAVGPMGDDDVKAWALPCAEVFRRPFTGVLHINPRFIIDDRESIRIIGHQMLHALGFHRGMLERQGLIRKVDNIRGKRDVSVFSGIQILEHTKEFYGCERAPGMEMEDAEGFDSSSPHWKRRNAKDDILSAIPGANFYTNLTIAAMQGTSFYIGNYTNAEHMHWGYKAGCKLLEEQCVVNSVSQYPSKFCTDLNTTRLHCSFGRTSMGPCLIREVGTLPPEFNYFPPEPIGSPLTYLMEYCPYIEPTNKSFSCTAGSVASMPGSVISNSSSCFESRTGVGVKASASPVHALCASVTCEKDTKTYSVRVGGSTVDLPCEEGESITPRHHSDIFGPGSVLCPSYDEICHFGTVSDQW